MDRRRGNEVGRHVDGGLQEEVVAPRTGAGPHRHDSAARLRLRSVRSLVPEFPLLHEFRRRTASRITRTEAALRLRLTARIHQARGNHRRRNPARVAGESHRAGPAARRRRAPRPDGGGTVFPDPGVWSGKYAIITVPLPMAASINYEPKLPGLLVGLAQRMPMGSEVKVFATYDRPFWREAGLSGQVVTDGGPLSVAFDNTTPGARSQPALLGLIGGKYAHTWGARPRDERREAVLSQFARWFGPKALKPSDYYEADWRSSLWTRGCPLAVMSAGAWMHFGAAMRQPFGRIHWAGSELSPEWCTYMHGAVISGEKAAAEIVDEL